MVGDEAARDVDALLLAAGEGCRRQRPKPFGQVQAGQQVARVPGRFGAVRAALDQRFGDDVEGGDAGHDPQELADIADRFAAQLQNRAGTGCRQVDFAVAMPNQDRAPFAP